MEQRQLRLGDILDDYCPRERRLTNHAVVAMIGAEVKQTRCTTCDAEHEYKHAKVPRQRKKSDSPAALYSQVSAGAPKPVVHEAPEPQMAGDHAGDTVDPVDSVEETADASAERVSSPPPAPVDQPDGAASENDEAAPAEESERDEGPVHRPLIRASLPRPEGQPPPSRPIPEFTIRQPGGRPGHFRARQGRGGGQQQFQGNRSNGNVAGPPRGGHRQGGGGRPPQGGGGGRRHGGQGRKRSK